MSIRARPYDTDATLGPTQRAQRELWPLERERTAAIALYEAVGSRRHTRAAEARKER